MKGGPVLDVGGGFKYFLSSPLFGEKIPIWTNIFHPGLKPPTRKTSMQHAVFSMFLLLQNFASRDQKFD